MTTRHHKGNAAAIAMAVEKDLAGGARHRKCNNQPMMVCWVDTTGKEGG